MKILKAASISLALLVTMGFITFVVLYSAGFRRYSLPTASMEPTIPKGGNAIGKLSDGYRDHIERFQIVMFTIKEKPGEIYAKRVVGLSGERVTVADRTVTINGAKLDLPSAVSTQGLGIKECDVLVPKDSVFVLGDNTAHSFDSRFLGPIPKSNVIGHILFK
jgi:signal peptidase I